MNMTRHNNLRRNEAVVPNGRVMADVVSAPDHDIAADRNEWLNRVVLKDETVVAGGFSPKSAL